MGTKRIVGIDLGTTYSVAAFVGKDGRAEIIRTLQNETTTPSVVYVDEATGDVVVGDAAKSQASAFPDQVVSFAKRFMGTSTTFPLKAGASGSRVFTPEEISAHVLKKIRQDAERVLGEEVSDVVITVPAYFGVAERKATEDAGAIAGLNVRHVISEPTAAAIAFGASQPQKAQTLLVFDLGGGTFDVTLLKVVPTSGRLPQIDVITCGGDDRLGGADWDRRMVEHVGRIFCEKYGDDPLVDPSASRDLMDRCERAKQALATARSATVVCAFNGKTALVQFDHKLLSNLTESLLLRCEGLVDSLLAEKAVALQQVDQVLLVGGSTKLVMVRQMLERKFGKERLNCSVHPDLCVAEGAAWYGHLLEEREVSSIKEMEPDAAVSLVNDVASFALGVKTYADETMAKQVVDTLIPKDTRLPCRATGRYRTLRDGQDHVNIEVYENDSRQKHEPADPDLSKLVGAVVLDVPPGPKGRAIEVHFMLDAGFRFTVRATDVSSGAHVEAEIAYAQGMTVAARNTARKEVAIKDVTS